MSSHSEETNWLAGLVKCRICSHEWAAVAPESTELENLECPNCGNMAGDREEDSE